MTEGVTRTAEHTQRPPTRPDEFVKLIAHPLRRRIVELLIQRVFSLSELAVELDAKPDQVRYHVGRLLQADAVELVRTEERRGAAVHFYRATRRAMFSDEEAAILPLEAQRAAVSEILELIGHTISRAKESGGFDRPDAHVSGTPLDLDEQGYQAVVEAAAAALDRAFEVQAEVSQRRADGESPAEGIRSELVVMHFLRAEGIQSVPVRRDPPQSTPAGLERAFTVAEDLSDELAEGEPDWSRARALVRELDALVETFATAAR